MALKDTAKRALREPAEPGEGAPGPVVAAAEQKALQASIDRAHARHGVPDSAVYTAGQTVYGDGSTDGRVIGKDAERAVAPVSPPPVAVRPGVIQVGGLRLTTEQYAMLLRPIDRRRIKEKQKQSHLEAWDVRRHLIRIFGFGGFSITTISREKIHERLTAPGEGKVTRWVQGEKRKVANDDWMYTVVYDCVVRLTVYGLDGTSAVYEDAATGDGANMPTYQQAADFAIKTAESQALKRCAVNLGDQFGLSLYNGGSYDPVVNVTLVGPAEVSASAVEQAAQSGEVHSEPEPALTDEGPSEDPGEETATGLPTAQVLANEALERVASHDRTGALVRLRQILAMVRRDWGDHPELGTAMVINGSGDEEALDRLIYNLIQDLKTPANKAGNPEEQR